MTLEELGCEVASQDHYAENVVEPTDDAEEGHFSIVQKLRFHVQARSILECHGNFSGQGRKAFYCCQRPLQLEKVLSMT